MFYITIGLIATLFAYLSVNINVKNRKVSIKGNRAPNKLLFFISFLVYLIPSALRYGIGRDYFYTYYPMFISINRGLRNIYTNGKISFSETGFNLLNKGISEFTDEPQWLFIVTSVLFLGLVFVAIKRDSVDVPLSVFFLILGSYYLASYSMIRQALATAIFIFSIKYIEEKKFVRYLICIAIAMSIHTAAILYIPIYFISNIKLKKKEYLIYLGFSIFGVRLFSGIVVRVVALTRFANRITFSESYNILQSIIIIFLFLIALYGFDQKYEDEKYRLYLNVFFIAACFIGLSPILATTDRLVFLFYYLNFLFLPYFYKKGNWGKYKKIVFMVIIILMSALWIHENIMHDQFGVFPYSSILNK